MSDKEVPSAATSSPSAGNGAEAARHPVENRVAGGQVDAEPQSAAVEVAELENRLRWALADLDNLRKRFDRELARQRAEERARVVAEWLPVLDNLDRALEHAGADAGALVEGVRAVRDQAVAVLARLGFPRYEDVGRPFDPARHEALGSLNDEAQPGTVVSTVRPGYGNSETVLRPAGVIVSKGRD